METIDEIKKELDRLARYEWLPIIEVLIENFRGYPFNDPDTQAPAPAICSILKNLIPSELPKSTDEEFIRLLSHNDMFSFRAVQVTPTGPVVWEPLQERFVDFDRSGETTKYQTAKESPPPDITRAWYYHKLKTIRQ